MLPESVITSDLRATDGDSQSDILPVWVKSAAKLLNGGSENQDWSALARKLGEDCILKNSIRDARTPQPREIFSTP